MGSGWFQPHRTTWLLLFCNTFEETYLLAFLRNCPSLPEHVREVIWEYLPEDAGEYLPEDAGEYLLEDAGEFLLGDGGEFLLDEGGECLLDGGTDYPLERRKGYGGSG